MSGLGRLPGRGWSRWWKSSREARARYSLFPLVASVVAAALVGYAGTVVWGQAGRVMERVPLLLLTREERLLRAYGYCAPAGYGYLKKIQARMPDSRKKPLVRYRDYDHRTEYWLEPPPLATDNRFLVGIGLSDLDVTDQQIALFRRTGQREWTLTTGDDWDRLNRLVLLTGARSPGPMRGVLFSHDRRRVRLWQGSFTATGEGWTAEMTPPVRSFSHSRGATPFLLELDGAPPDAVIAARGVRVDLDGYRIVESEGPANSRCWIAIQNGSIP